MRREMLKLGVGWVLCAAAWAACGGETKTVTNKELGFQISFPDSWDINEKREKKAVLQGLLLGGNDELGALIIVKV